MSRAYIALILLLGVSITTYSQYSYYKESVVIKNDSSRLEGYVEKQSESSLNPEIKFKENIEDKKYIGIPVTEINKIIFLSDSSVFERVKYAHLKDSVKVIEFRLAKKLLNGYAQLYKLQLPEEEQHIIFERQNTFVYIVKIDTNYYVLKEQEWQENHAYKLERNYVGVLKYLLRDYPELSARVEYLDFRDKPVITLFRKLNDYHPEVRQDFSIKKEKPWLLQEVLVSGTDVVESKKNTGYGFGVGYNIQIVYPQLSEKYSTDIGFSLNSYLKIYDTNFDGKYYLRVPLGTTYRFNNNRISPFAHVGLTFYYFYQYDFYFRFSGALGITFFKHEVISASFETLPVRGDARYFSLNLGYLFGKH